MGKIAVQVFDACSEPPTASEKVKRRQHVLTIYDEETSGCCNCLHAESSLHFSQAVCALHPHLLHQTGLPRTPFSLHDLQLGGLAISIFMANHDVATPLCAPECCVQCTGLGIPPYIARLQKCIVFASAFNYLCEWKVMPCRLIKN